jgi:FSR family fosmidomycin resistance protein-like MFS transporter
MERQGDMKTAQTTAPPKTSAPLTGPFQAGQVFLFAGGHLIHDVFGSFIAPLLPLIIQKMELSLTLAGSLTVFQRLPSMANPFIGLLADRVNLRWFVILAPTVTAVAMSAIGLAPTYAALAILLLVAGMSSAAWHVPAPVMTAQVSGSRIGQGMSLFMLGGELARTVGPLLAVGAVSLWGLEGIWRAIPLGVTASLILYWQLRAVTAHPQTVHNGSLVETWRVLRRALLPITGIIFARSFMTAALTTFLPILLTSEGASLWYASGSLSILELAGALGALTSGTLSDRVGRRQVLAFVMVTSPLTMLLFLTVRGWLSMPVLIVLGFLAFSTSPVMMAVIQENGRDRPATANGLYMAAGFLIRSAVVVAVGIIADRWGLRTAFQWSALLAFTGLPFVLLLPKQVPEPDQ